MIKNASAREITVAIEQTCRRFCSHHRGEVDASAGCVVERNKSRRFICFTCQEKSAKRDAEIRARKA